MIPKGHAGWKVRVGVRGRWRTPVTAISDSDSLGPVGSDFKFNDSDMVIAQQKFYKVGSIDAPAATCIWTTMEFNSDAISVNRLALSSLCACEHVDSLSCVEEIYYTLLL